MHSATMPWLVRCIGNEEDALRSEFRPGQFRHRFAVRRFHLDLEPNHSHAAPSVPQVGAATPVFENRFSAMSERESRWCPPSGAGSRGRRSAG